MVTKRLVHLAADLFILGFHDKSLFSCVFVCVFACVFVCVCVFVLCVCVGCVLSPKWYQSRKWSIDIDRMMLLSSYKRPTREQHLLLMFSKLRFHLLQLFPWQRQDQKRRRQWEKTWVIVGRTQTFPKLLRIQTAQLLSCEMSLNSSVAGHFDRRKKSSWIWFSKNSQFPLKLPFGVCTIFNQVRNNISTHKISEMEVKSLGSEPKKAEECFTQQNLDGRFMDIPEQKPSIAGYPPIFRPQIHPKIPCKPCKQASGTERWFPPRTSAMLWPGSHAFFRFRPLVTHISYINEAHWHSHWPTKTQTEYVSTKNISHTNS